MGKTQINIIGAGLAGCEAALQSARFGIYTRVFEMKPGKHSPAHHSDNFAELVCSNSLKSDRLDSASGLLKSELRMAGSFLLECADMARVPAGGALAVDRELFSRLVTEKIKNNPLIEVVNCEVDKIDLSEKTIVAAGPLASEKLSEEILNITGEESVYFFDAAAPLVYSHSIDRGKVFRASRYGKGGDDYINCPMDKTGYDNFIRELINAGRSEVKEFDRNMLFEGCMPIESLAERGHDAARFGPLKPVGLKEPVSGKEPWAVVQLRQDDIAATLYNIVGFQTRLAIDEQKRVFRLIPGLENAEFARFGMMHRNTFINSPALLDNCYNMENLHNLYFAGQITGVEGYVESISSGLVAGINASFDILGLERLRFPPCTVIGSLAKYISDRRNKRFQPMNANYGILDMSSSDEFLPEDTRGRKILNDKKLRYQNAARYSLSVIEKLIKQPNK